MATWPRPRALQLIRAVCAQPRRLPPPPPRLIHGNRAVGKAQQPRQLWAPQNHIYRLVKSQGVNLKINLKIKREGSKCFSLSNYRTQFHL